MAGQPGVGALVLECTGLVSFAHEIQARTGVPVLGIATLTGLVHASPGRRPFPVRTTVSGAVGTS
jgi:Asp/Glu/hydantoin racemase